MPFYIIYYDKESEYNMEQYIIYLRKSRADADAELRGEGETLARHQDTLIELAKRQGLPVKEIYKEIVSGETIVARPMMQKLLQEVEKGLWSGVLVMEIERLARGDTIDQGIVSQAFKYTNTKIITPSKTYDPSNEFDEEYFEFGLFMSRREFKTINRRIQRGRLASVKEGKFISSVAPYGYTRIKIKNAKGYTLEIQPEQANTIRAIFEWYTIGEPQIDGSYLKLGAARIASKLDELGIKPMFKDTWSRASITDILKNPTYMGKIRWSFRKELKVLENNELKKKRQDTEDFILVDGIHEPIIDIDTFNLAQDIMNKRVHRPVPGNTILKNPLSGLIYCGKCGTLMTRLAKTKKTPYDAIKCPNRYCDNISSPLYLVEQVLIDELKKWLHDFKAKWRIEKLDIPYTKLINEKENIIINMGKQLDKLIEQREKTYTFLEQGLYTPEVFNERNKKLTTQINEVNSAITEITIEIDEIKEQANKNEIFIPNAEHVLDIYCNLDNAVSRNEHLKEIIEKIEYIKTEPNRKGNRENANFEIRLYPKIIKF